MLIVGEREIILELASLRIVLQLDDMVQAFFEARNTGRIVEELPDSETLSVWITVPLTVLGDVEAPLVVYADEVSSSLGDGQYEAIGILQARRTM